MLDLAVDCKVYGVAMTHLLPIVAVAVLSAQHHAPTGEAMGFDQDAAVHHFTITPAGGTIEVQARNRRDQKTIDAIHMHLSHIASMFADGDFEAPFVTHGENPPGVETLQRLKSAVTYSYVPTKTGGRVEIATTNPEARDALHEFLRYQIAEHKTGDRPKM